MKFYVYFILSHKQNKHPNLLVLCFMAVYTFN